MRTDYSFETKQNEAFSVKVTIYVTTQTYIHSVQLKSGPLTKLSDAIYSGSAGMTLYCYMCIFGKTVAGSGRTGLGHLYQLNQSIAECWCLNNAIFYAFIMRFTVEERVFILESYLQTMSYVHSRQSFFEKFGKQAPVKSAIAKMIKK